MSHPTDPADVPESHRPGHLARLFEQAMDRNGSPPVAPKGMRFIKADRTRQSLYCNRPCLLFVLQGSLRVACHGENLICHSGQYLVASELEMTGCSGRPALALALELDLKLAAELLLYSGHRDNSEARIGIFPALISTSIADGLRRLLEALVVPADARVLGPYIVRELLYRVLTGPRGAMLQALFLQKRRYARVGIALRRISTEYHTGLDVMALARDAGMSVAAFHANFKAVTGTTPIQYLKAIRLKEARLLMLQRGMTATRAADAVGYESCSQFCREFKRRFGRTPTQEAAHLRKGLPQGVGRPGSERVSERDREPIAISR